MKNHRILLVSIGIVAFLFVSSIAYGILNDRGPYDQYTGLGSGISVSPDDTTLAFSYYQDGKESIYKGDIETGETEKITNPEEQDHRFPQFSPDGESLLYLSADDNNVQSLHYLNNGETTELTENDIHVFSAAFSPDGTTVYFTAMPADDFLKPEGEAENGADLFAVPLNGSPEQLTDKDAFSLDSLSVSADGESLYYTAFDGTQQLYVYDLGQETERLHLSEHLQGDVYQPAFSPNDELLAYTAVANAAEGGTFEYELFLLDASTGDTTRLTDYNASVTSPAFFQQEERIAFLAQSNWPGEPASFEVMTVDFDGNVAPLRFSLPEATQSFHPADIADRFVNTATLTGLYLLLFGLLSVYFHSALNKVYLPALVSAGLTALVFLGSFAAAAVNPWFGIGLFTLSAGLAICTLLIAAFAFVFRRMAG